MLPFPDPIRKHCKPHRRLWYRFFQEINVLIKNRLTVGQETNIKNIVYLCNENIEKRILMHEAFSKCI